MVVGATPIGHADPRRRAGAVSASGRRCAAASPNWTGGRRGGRHRRDALRRERADDDRPGEGEDSRRVEPGLPAGVVLRPVYDRSDLIHRAIENLRDKLVEESVIVALVCIVFLLHARSALVAIVTLPIGILMAFIAMRSVGVGADIMSLGGIAIAIGAMIDAAIVMIENMHKHLERAVDPRRTAGMAGRQRRLDTSILDPAERWAVVRESAQEVGPALFFSLLIITVSFLPVFALEGQEGRLFQPLAFTKTFAMAAASLLSVTLVPVTMGLFIRGRICRERANPINRLLIRAYRPIITFVLRHRWPVVGGALVAFVLTLDSLVADRQRVHAAAGRGHDSVHADHAAGRERGARARDPAHPGRILACFPEVDHVWGKAGRAKTATDPAGLDMFETTITLKPESEWRQGMTLRRAGGSDGLRGAAFQASRMRGPCRSRGGSTCWPPASARRWGSRSSDQTSRYSNSWAREIERAVQAGPGHAQRVRRACGLRATTSTSTSTARRRRATGSTWVMCRRSSPRRSAA